MRVKFLDKQDQNNPMNGLTCVARHELAAVLEKWRFRKPFGLDLVGENGLTLDIGLAENFGSVQYSASNGNPPYLLALAPACSEFNSGDNTSPFARAFLDDEQNGRVPPEFLIGGTPSPILTRYIVPYNLVNQIAIHFLETGERYPDVLWEEI